MFQSRTLCAWKLLGTEGSGKGQVDFYGAGLYRTGNDQKNWTKLTLGTRIQGGKTARAKKTGTFVWLERVANAASGGGHTARTAALLDGPSGHYCAAQ